MEHTTRDWKKEFDEKFNTADIVGYPHILTSNCAKAMLDFIESIEKEAQARGEKIGEERKRKELADFIRENRNTVTLVQIENLIDNF